MKNILFIINFFITFILLNCQSNNYNSESFLDWGLKNKLRVSSFIETSLLGKNKIKFIALTDIPEKQDLLTIPYSLMCNLSKALELINLKSLNKQYKEFEKLNITNHPNFRKEKAFLAYIFYLINHKPKKYQKTKFYEFYHKYLEVLDKYYPKSPLFYGPKQVEYLAGTLLDRQLDALKKIYEDEILIYSNKTYYKRELDFDEYAHYRIAINKYGLNISNQWTLVPFMNYFDDDYNLNNANYTIEKNGDVKIYSLKEIKRGEQIILKAEKKTNIARLILEGKTNEELVDYFYEYSISAFSPGIYYQYGISDIDYFKSYYVNILEKNFDKELAKIYKENAELLNGDGTEIWAYDIVELNLNFYKEHFEGITLEKIYDIYYDTDDRTNIERIIRGETKIILKAYEDANKVIDVLIEEEEKKKRMKRAKKEAESAAQSSESDELGESDESAESGESDDL